MTKDVNPWEEEYYKLDYLYTQLLEENQLLSELLEELLCRKKCTKSKKK